MTELTLPETVVDARRTPTFDLQTLPAPLARVHRSTVWATLHVHEGSVRYTDLEGAEPRDVRVLADEELPIAPGVAHHIEPSTDARFFVQFHRQPDAPLVPGHEEPFDAVRRSGPWEHRGRDLDTSDEVTEFVIRQYVDICQDSLLERYFAFGSDFTDWDAHVLAGTDFWSQALSGPPNRDVDAVLERFRRRHEQVPFTVEAFDRWLAVFDATVDGGWSGPSADHLKKRAIGMAWAVASRTLGKGVWQPADRR